MMMEKKYDGYCFILLRPETVERKLIGTMIAKIESLDCSIIHMELQTPDPDKIYALYEKPELERWRDEIVKNHSLGKLVALFVGGGSDVCHEVSLIVKQLRARYGISQMLNGIHSSDSSSQAVIEARIFFPDMDIYPNFTL